ncbi:MAG: radical SAM protein [Dehalococcoidia bacterium]|nr:radical SAM protein [Dehalococcoidia bacterium]
MVTSGNRVLLINPNRMKPATAPIALDCLGESLRKHRFNVDVLDLCFSEEPIRELDRYFKRSGDPSLIAVTIRNTDDTYYASQDFCLDHYRNIVNYISVKSNSAVVLGGSGFSVMPEAILEYFDLSMGIWGEGEYSLPFLLRTLATRGQLSDVPGLVYRNGNDDFQRNAPLQIDLAKMPPLARDNVDNVRYFNEGGMVGIESKRGCSMRCSYCADPLGKGSKIRLRSPESVAEELASLVDRGIDHFHFCDSEFNIPASHADEVCTELIRNGVGKKIRWYAYVSPVPFTEELARLFVKSGCAGLNFGADSGSNTVLRELKRDFTVRDLVNTADICRKYSIPFMYDLLMGGPGETRETLKESVELMKRISPDRVGVSLGIRLWPGTNLAEMVTSGGSLVENPNLKGRVTGNQSLLFPIFYLSSKLGMDVDDYLADLIDRDERFFFGTHEAGDANYNYNDNSILVNAIKNGYRGAYWDILRRLAEK